MTLFGASHLGNRAKSVQECLLILISLVAPYASKVPTLRKISLRTPVYLASTVLKNQLFKTFPIQMHYEANLTLMLSRSRSSWDHHLNKLGRPHIPNATYQVSRSLALWFWRRRFLKGFYHIWAWRPSLSCDQNILHKFWLTYHKESSHEI